jgi:hypothetical protein
MNQKKKNQSWEIENTKQSIKNSVSMLEQLEINQTPKKRKGKKWNQGSWWVTWEKKWSDAIQSEEVTGFIAWSIDW